MKITLPSQTVPIDVPEGVDPVWYEKLQALAAFANLFSEVDPKALTNGQVLIWDFATKKFRPGAN